MRCVLCLPLLWFCSAFAVALAEPAPREPQVSSQAAAPETEESPADDKPRSGWAALPVATYAPETQLGLGAFGSYFFRFGEASAHTRPSSLSVVGLYTLRQQVIAEIIPELYWDRHRWHMWTRVDYRSYPNRVWAIGPRAPSSSEEAFTENRWRWQARAGRWLVDDLWLYGHLEALWMSLPDTADGGLLARGVLPGSQGGRSVGLGPGVAWDSRDHLLVPRRGSFHELVMMTWQDAFASDFRFTSLRLNLRTFVPVFETHVLALQAYGELQAGHVPFYKLAQLGGQNLLRGYFEGRFRDKSLLAFQAEYRLPLLWRLGAVVHAGVGGVAPTPARLPIERPEWSLGAGLRVMLNRDERLNLRIDSGFGRDTYGIYVSVAEAF